MSDAVAAEDDTLVLLLSSTALVVVLRLEFPPPPPVPVTISPFFSTSSLSHSPAASINGIENPPSQLSPVSSPDLWTSSNTARNSGSRTEIRKLLVRSLVMRREGVRELKLVLSDSCDGPPIRLSSAGSTHKPVLVLFEESEISFNFLLYLISNAFPSPED